MRNTARILFTLVALVLSLVTLAKPGGAAFPGGNGLIAFWGDRDGPIQIYVMNSDGSGVRNLSNNPNVLDGLPRWSPDGTHLVFSRVANGSPFQLYTMDASGGNLRGISDPTVNANNYFAAWTSSGRQIVFYQGPGECGPGGSLWVVNADGTSLRRLTDPPFIACLSAPSPRGSQVAFTGSIDGGATFQIYVIGLDGSGLRRLSPAGTQFDYRPNWSPDGSALVFLNAPANEQLYRGLWTMRTDGTQRTQILSGAPSWDSPAWSPDGRYIVLHTCTDEQNHFTTCRIFTVRRDGTDLNQLTFAQPGHFDSNADWQPIPVIDD